MNNEEDDSMSPANVAKADQALKYLGDSLPALWYEIFNNLIAKGMTRVEAFAWVNTYIAATCARSKE